MAQVNDDDAQSSDKLEAKIETDEKRITLV